MGVCDGTGAVKNLSPLERFCSEMFESHRALKKFPWYSSWALENILDFTASGTKCCRFITLLAQKQGQLKLANPALSIVFCISSSLLN